MDFYSKIQQSIEQGSSDQGSRRNENSAGVEKLLADITQECERFENAVAEELETARRRNMSPEHIAELETKLKSVQGLNAENLKGLKLRLKQAKEREKQQADAEAEAIAERASKEKETIKAEMRDAWVRSGGDLPEFEESWPELYKAEMIRRTQSRTHLTEPSTPSTREEMVRLIRSR